MTERPEALKREAFFASRSGVCVYVTVERQAVRVCFPSPDSEPTADGDELGRGREEAIAVATAAFHAHREDLLPLFEYIAEASQGGPGSRDGSQEPG